jgi:predicted DNA-binding protein YlxM (UPF0122 family)
MNLSREQMETLLRENDLSFTKVAYALNTSPQAVKQMARRMGLIIVRQIAAVEPSAKRKSYSEQEARK